jgi:bifunctional non-homologous end joining protein LigD
MPSRQVRGDGSHALAVARERGWEGVIAKLRGSLYEPGARSRSWLKLKVRGESEFVIGGYTPPQGARAELGALLVGLYDGPRLRFTGKVGTGYTAETLRDLGAKLRRLRDAHSPFDPAPRLRDVTWVRPELVAQIAYAEWTADGKLRQPAFLGLRDDKRPRECTWREREPVASAASTARRRA